MVVREKEGIYNVVSYDIYFFIIQEIKKKKNQIKENKLKNNKLKIK